MHCWLLLWMLCRLKICNFVLRRESRVGMMKREGGREGKEGKEREKERRKGKKMEKVEEGKEGEKKVLWSQERKKRGL